MNKNFYSQTMLTKYINCKHIISNEYYEKPLKLKRNKRTITDSLRIESGLQATGVVQATAASRRSRGSRAP